MSLNKNKNISINKEQSNIFDPIVILSTKKINRIEVIDENGRSYINWQSTNKIKLQVQDNGRTLKVFVSQNNQS